MSNLQKHKKTHKNNPLSSNEDGNMNTASAVTSVSNDETESALSALTDGQHIFYVTADQTQLVISTIGSEENGLSSNENIQYSTMMENGVTMVQLDGNVAHNLSESMHNEEAADSESVLAIVGDGDTDNQVGQAIQITTEDGRRVTLIIPSNGDPCEIGSDY